MWSGGVAACLARSLRREGTNLRSTFCCVPLTAYAFIAAVSATSVAAFLRCQQQPSQLAPHPRPPPRLAQQTTHLSMHKRRQRLPGARSHQRRLSRCHIKSIKYDIGFRSWYSQSFDTSKKVLQICCVFFMSFSSCRSLLRRCRQPVKHVAKCRH